MLTTITNKYPVGYIAPDCVPPVSNNEKEFFEDLRVILRAAKAIKNPTINKKILEFYLSALIFKYAEYKISWLIETNLTNTLNRLLHYVRESECSKL
ncbi:MULTISPECIES: hypothetical protein [Niastella]|uniref:Uncharacterized protein n=1 Tax=Niastella soli TaxID=2821487 RepID=A0ABS3YZE0_9BACT|nr:hypothetical protein [Niastella soli]MBO9203199.1 hypothetical protein [Niastella soli]